MDKKSAATLLVILVSVARVSSQVSKSGHCPLPQTVTTCMARCKGDYDCSFSKKCCPNSCGSTSCTDASLVSTGSGPRDSSRGSVYCGNVKCSSGEKCVLDRSTKREKCGRN